jgi:hypothetical protein
MKSVVFIPTKRRLHCLEKVLPKWQEQDVEIHIVGEREDTPSHLELISGSPFKNVHSVLTLPKSNRGIAYARSWIVDLADSWGIARIIMADDDLYPHPDSDVNRLMEFDRLRTLGIGAMLPFYGLTFGNNTIRERDDPLLMTNAMGKRLFSLDIARALKCGNFDSRLHTFGSDNEIVREGIARYGYTWYVHAGVQGVSIGGRHEQGGLNALHDEDEDRRAQAEFSCHRMMHERWPEYINKPRMGGNLVCRWKKMLDEFCPDWKKRINWTKR